MTSSRRAIVLVSFAYMWWGGSAIFWRELGSVAPVDQFSFRVLTGFAYLALVWAFRRHNPLGSLTKAHLAYGVAAGALIAVNWIVFLWAVDNGRAVEASLGYFLMPLFSVALGVGLLGEQLRPLQKNALGLATVGIVWTFVAVGTIPWVALALGGSFALYGWARKQGPWDAVNGLTFETMLLVPFLLPLLAWRGAGDVAITGDGDLTTFLLIAATGLVTIIPLLLFASAAKQVPLTTIGLLQYINPVLQFIVGWQVLGEPVTLSRLLGFAWIWAALALVVIDELSSKRPVHRSASSVR